MDRQIIFRLWDGNKIINNPVLSFGEFGWGAEGCAKGDAVLMRFAGIPDMNGNKIFEFDRVKLIQANREYYVKFHNGCFKLFHADPKLNDMLWGTLERAVELGWDMEVTGHKFDNPELLCP